VVAIRKRSSNEPRFRLIRKVEINYLRSLYHANIQDPSDINLLFGRNDSGKSNFLRGLNLFFNNATAPDQDVDFAIDFSDIRKEEARVAKGKQFISVRVDFNVPLNFQKSLGNTVSIKRQWNIFGDMNETIPKHLTRPQKIQLTKLINQIDYTYIPAIKDNYVFGDLIERMYEAAATSTALQSSVSGFVDAIRSETKGLSEQISKSLGTGSELAAPSRLGEIFRTLDFSLGEGGHSLLLQKGDGIKARHLPELLRFVNENETGKKFFIWGFEEPENSLDLAAAEQEFQTFAQMGARQDTQIFITSHSPVFYLAEVETRHRCSIKRYFVSRQDRGTKARDVVPPEAIREVPDINSADEVMREAGLMQLPFLARELAAYKKSEEELQEKLEAARKAVSHDKATIFVEGESDKIVLQKYIELKKPNVMEKIAILTRASGGGDTYVFDMLMAWRHWHKHNTDGPKAAGLVDVDVKGEGIEDRLKEFNATPKNVASAKAFRMCPPSLLYPCFAEGFRIPICLETHYGVDIWSLARDEKKLQEVDWIGRVPKDKAQVAACTGATVEFGNAELFVKYQFRNEEKIKMAKRIVGLEASKLDPILESFSESFEQIFDYLFPST